MKVTLKRVVLNPLAYLTPFVVLIVVHHLPLLIAFGAIDKPATGYDNCDRLQALFHWLLVAFVLHLATAGAMLVSALLTLGLRVYHRVRPESPLILLVFLLYIGNLGWTIYGEVALRTDTAVCGDVNWRTVQHRADAIGGLQHFDFILTIAIVALGACTSYMCGVHSGDDVGEAERRWQKRCMCMFRACTCSAVPESDDDIFESLGRMLGKFFVVRYQTDHYEGLSFTDLTFSLGLVSRVQRKQRKRDKQRADVLASQGAPTVVHFPAMDEQSRLQDLAYYGKLAIGVYGWPVYVWYSPFYWFRVFGCFKKPTQDQIVDHDNYVHGNRVSFINYTGVQDDALVYLNCSNSVFQAPYSIVKDAARKELVISVRGSLSFYDFVTDGLAQIVAMDPSELPADVPNVHNTRTHYGMLRTARSLFKDLQEGSPRELFWDFALANCAIGGPTDDEESDWKIVVCGHSMGAGVGGILAVLLRKVFPTTRAYLYAPPMLFDPATAEWTKEFATTAVYGDDLVPRLSIANVARLRDEMADQFDEVAPQRLFKIKYGKQGKLKVVDPPLDEHQPDVEPPTSAMLPTVSSMAPTESSTEPPSSGTLTLDLGTNEFPGSGGIVNISAVEPSSSRTLIDSARDGAAPFDPASSRNTTFDPAASGASSATTRDKRSNTDMVRLPLEPESQDVDVPGVIVHIETVKMARRCGCTVFLGEQEMQYTLRDASYFRRIWVTPRALQDHMVHHYDRNIRHLVDHCLDFETRAADHGTSTSRVSSSWASEAGLDREPLTPQATKYREPLTPQATTYREIADVV